MAEMHTPSFKVFPTNQLPLDYVIPETDVFPFLKDTDALKKEYKAFSHFLKVFTLSAI